MSDSEKFDGFVQQQIQENEDKYGAEVRQKYGDKAMDEANARIGKLSKAEYEALQAQHEQIYSDLAGLFTSGLAADDEQVQAVIRRHHDFLGNYGTYTLEMYQGLGQTYASDERFVAFYDEFAVGLAAFLHQAIDIYCQA